MYEDSTFYFTVHNTSHSTMIMCIMNGYVTQECEYLGSDIMPLKMHLNSSFLVDEGSPRTFRHQSTHHLWIWQIFYVPCEH